MRSNLWAMTIITSIDMCAEAARWTQRNLTNPVSCRNLKRDRRLRHNRTLQPGAIA